MKFNFPLKIAAVSLSLVLGGASAAASMQTAVDSSGPSRREAAADTRKRKTPAKKSKPTAKPRRAAPASKSSTNPKGSIGGSLKRSALPQSRALEVPAPNRSRSMGAVKPPRSNSFLDSDTKEAQYENLLDQEIRALFKLSQKTKKSANRGEIWLRLAERYVEKARLVEFRVQNEYDRKVKDFLEKKTNQTEARFQRHS